MTTQDIITKQLGGAARIYAMTDAKAIIGTKKGIQIMFPRNKYFAVELQGNDLYTIKAFTLNGRTLEIKTTLEKKDIFNHQLVGFLEFVTGSVLSF